MKPHLFPPTTSDSAPVAPPGLEEHRLETSGRERWLGRERVLAARAALRFGVFHRSEARDVGLDDDWAIRRLAAGRLHRVHPDVFRFAGVPSAVPGHDLMAAALQIGRDGVVSHRAAAWVHGLDGFRSAAVELTVSRSTHVAPTGAVVHRLAAIDPVDIVEIGPWRVTAPARTLIDLAAIPPRWRVEVALDDAWRRRLVGRDELVERLAANAGKGRRGAGVMRGLLAARPASWKPLDSRMERRLLDELTAAGVPRPETQLQIVRPDGCVALFDLAWPEHRLGVEFHGYQWHHDRQSWESGVTRDNALVSLGWRILYATRHEVLSRPWAFAADVRRALAA